MAGCMEEQWLNTLPNGKREFPIAASPLFILHSSFRLPLKIRLERFPAFPLITPMLFAQITGLEVFIMLFSCFLGVAWVVVVHRYLKGEGYDAGLNPPDDEGAAAQGHGHSHRGH